VDSQTTKYDMTLATNKKLEELFDLPPSDESSGSGIAESTADLPITRDTLQALDEAIDKVDSALPAVRGLDASDAEMDELAKLAVEGYNDLSNLGMQVDSRFASEIFSVASNMLGHAITAKTAKLDKKLKMIDLQMKKMRLDQQQQLIDQKKPPEDDGEATQTGTGVVLSRNDLLERLLGRKDQNATKE
jgi:hypothetical protein